MIILPMTRTFVEPAGIRSAAMALTGSQEVRGFESLRLHEKVLVKGLDFLLSSHILALTRENTHNPWSEASSIPRITSGYPGIVPSLSLVSP